MSEKEIYVHAKNYSPKDIFNLCQKSEKLAEIIGEEILLTGIVQDEYIDKNGQERMATFLLVGDRSFMGTGITFDAILKKLIRFAKDEIEKGGIKVIFNKTKRDNGKEYFNVELVD